jgi:HEAT repeat protein
MSERDRTARAASDDPVERAADLAALGLAGRGTATEPDVAMLRTALHDDPDARVRVAALGALVRRARRAVARDAWVDAIGDRDASVRRRAAELAPALGRHVPVRALLALLRDDDASVAEAAAFALGERAAGSKLVIDALATAATAHDDPLVREAAVAALGALGDERGRDAILRACHDRPAIRRRAVLALASFEGEDVDAALHRALEDHDWQVRQAAEDLLAP